MNKKTLGAKLDALSNGKKSQWSHDANWRKGNRAWLNASAFVSMQIFDALEILGWNQKKLAEIMEVSPQRISKILSGKENLTIQTIKELNKALNIQIETDEDLHYQYAEKVNEISKKLNEKESEIALLKKKITEINMNREFVERTIEIKAK